MTPRSDGRDGLRRVPFALEWVINKTGVAVCNDFFSQFNQFWVIKAHEVDLFCHRLGMSMVFAMDNADQFAPFRQAEDARVVGTGGSGGGGRRRIGKDNRRRFGV